MRENRFLFRLVIAPVAVAVAVGILLPGAPASAAPARGTLGTIATVTPATGFDVSIATVRTSGGCTAGGNAVFTDVVGPINSATPVFPPAQPFNITTATTAPFSATDPMDIPWDGSMANAARTVGKTLAVGEYDFTTHCVDSITLQEFGTFTGALIFSDSTHYTVVGGGASPAPTSSSTPTSSPAPSSSAAPTSSPIPSSMQGNESDSATTAPATGMNDSVGTSTPSDAAGTQPASSTGDLANTGVPIAFIFIGGLILLATGLALVVWLQRSRTVGSSSDKGDAPEE